MSFKPFQQLGSKRQQMKQAADVIEALQLLHKNQQLLAPSAKMKTPVLACLR